MTPTSPRLDPRLAAAALVLDDPTAAAAETWRRVGVVADRLGLPRPGYDTVRRTLLDGRRRRAEINSLLDPIAVDLARGRVSIAHLERIRAAVEIAGDGRKGRRH